MKPILSLFTCLASLTVLAACNQGNNVQTITNHSASAETIVAPNTYTIFASDNKVSLNLLHANYTDQLPNKNTFAKTYLPNTDAENLTILQTDPNKGMIVYAQNQSTANFSHIESNLKQDKAIYDLQIDTSIKHQIRYQFSHQVYKDTVHESCLFHQEKESILICAANTNGDFHSLNRIIKSVNIHLTPTT